MTPTEYWRHVPARFHDLTNFTVARVTQLAFRTPAHPTTDDVQVYDTTGALVWTSPQAFPAPAAGPVPEGG